MPLLTNTTIVLLCDCLHSYYVNMARFTGTQHLYRYIVELNFLRDLFYTLLFVNLRMLMLEQIESHAH
jgi:hypothetical protein